jgi:hypothetical protein
MHKDTRRAQKKMKIVGTFNGFKADTAVFLYMLKLLSGRVSGKRQGVAGHWLQIRFVEGWRVGRVTQ